MADPNDTLPPRTPNTPRKALAWLWAWSQVHTVAAAVIGGLLGGFILGKIL